MMKKINWRSIPVKLKETHQSQKKLAFIHFIILFLSGFLGLIGLACLFVLISYNTYIWRNGKINYQAFMASSRSTDDVTYKELQNSYLYAYWALIFFPVIICCMLYFNLFKETTLITNYLVSINNWFKSFLEIWLPFIGEHRMIASRQSQAIGNLYQLLYLFSFAFMLFLPFIKFVTLHWLVEADVHALKNKKHQMKRLLIVTLVVLIPAVLWAYLEMIHPEVKVNAEDRSNRLYHYDISTDNKFLKFRLPILFFCCTLMPYFLLILYPTFKRSLTKNRGEKL